MTTVQDPNPERTKRFRLVSRALIIVTGLVWGIYDVFPAINLGRGDTISENLRDWSRTVWTIPFFFGALVAHLFVNVGQPAEYKMLFKILLGIFAALILLNVVTWRMELVVSMWARATMLFVGMLAGVLLWSQNP